MSKTNLTAEEQKAVNRYKHFLREGVDTEYGGGCVRDLLSIIDRLDAELVALKEKLPQTADGVTAVPGMEAFPDESGFPGEYKGLRWIVDNDPRYCRTVVEGDPSKHTHGTILTRLMYSAYEAAQSAGNHKGDYK